MKQTATILIISILLLSCKTKYVHVPVETIKTEIEFIDRLERDSVYMHDSVFVAHRNDTVWMEKYKYIYKDKIVRDSIFIQDSVKLEVSYPVIETVEVNKLKNWQIILMCLGAGFAGWVAFRIIRFIKK